MSTLSEEIITEFRPIGFQMSTRSDKRILSMRITANGSRLMATTNYNWIEIYDCNKGVQFDSIPTKKYGCCAFDFGENDDEIVVSSTVGDNVIRSLNIEKKSYVALYAGHDHRVMSVKAHRGTNMMMSSCANGRLLLWDMRSRQCIAERAFGAAPVADWHPTGSLIAVGKNSEIVELFDVRGLGFGPFAKFRCNQEQNSLWTRLQFSDNGKLVLISTNGTTVKCVETMFGNVLHFFSKSILCHFIAESYLISTLFVPSFTGRNNSLGIPLDATFTPGVQYVLSGTSSGAIEVWNQLNGRHVTQLRPAGPDAITSIEFNSKLMLMATASSNVSFWVPRNYFQAAYE